MENKTVKVIARFNIMLTRVGLIVEGDNVDVRLNKEQYDRMKASFDTGKFRVMNEDIDIMDLYALFSEAGKPADNQVLLVDYPNTILDGKTFEEVLKLQSKKMTTKEWVEWVDREMADDLARMDEITQANLQRLEGTIEEEEARETALDEFQSWMKGHGLDAGVQNYALIDKDCWAVDTVDIGWEHGLYGTKGYTKPVALQFYHSTPELIELAKANGFEVFESIEELKAFVEKHCLGR